MDYYRRIRRNQPLPRVTSYAPKARPGRVFYSPSLRIDVVRPRTSLMQVEDRRRYHPLGSMAPAATLSRRDQRRLVEKTQHVGREVRRASFDPFASWVMPAAKLGFAVPKKVAVCVRRKQRREAMFATGKSGGGNSSRRRRNQFSEIIC